MLICLLCTPIQAPPPEDLAFCGALEYYDKSFDRVTPKTERPLKKTQRAFRSVTTSDDPVIRRVAPRALAAALPCLDMIRSQALLLSSACKPGNESGKSCREVPVHSGSCTEVVRFNSGL